MTPPGQHLTDEAFAELLAGNRRPAAQAHLQACEACRHEADEVGSALEGFRGEGLAWAEARVEKQPPLWAETKALARQNKGSLLNFPSAFPRSARAAAAILLACTAIGGVLRLSDRSAPTHAHASSTLSEDNRLLLSIDEELSAQEPSPRDMYAISASAAHSGHDANVGHASDSAGELVSE